MNLKYYLFNENKSVVDFAKEIGISRNYLSRIANQYTRPSKILAQVIEMKTNGKVTERELMKVDYKNDKNEK